jgi:hypothetical protein
MLSSEVRSFAEPADYAAAIRATKAEVLVTERGQFAAKLVRIGLHSLWMQRYEEALPRVAHSALVSGRAIVTFRTAPGPRLLLDRMEIQPNSIVRLSAGRAVILRLQVSPDLNRGGIVDSKKVIGRDHLRVVLGGARLPIERLARDGVGAAGGAVIDEAAIGHFGFLAISSGRKYIELAGDEVDHRL